MCYSDGFFYFYFVDVVCAVVGEGDVVVVDVYGGGVVVEFFFEVFGYGSGDLWVHGLLVVMWLWRAVWSFWSMSGSARSIVAISRVMWFLSASRTWLSTVMK